MYINILQKINNLLYKIFKDTGFVINLQVYINKKRFEKNEPDPDSIIYYDDDKPFIQ